MERNRVQLYLLYLLWLLAGILLVGCTAGPVEEIVPEESRPVALSFGRPNLGVPELLTRAGEVATPPPTPLPAGATVRIGAYFTGNVGDVPAEASFSTEAPLFEATYVVGDDGSLSPCCVNGNGEQTAGTAKGLSVRSGVYDFYAVSPARPLLQGNDGFYKITGIPHKEDVMTSFVRGVAVTKIARQVTLRTFSRKCAMLVFNVAPSPGNALPFDRLYGTSLVIRKISSSGAALLASSDTGILPTGGSEGAEAEVLFSEEEFEPVEAGVDPVGSGLNKTKGIVLPKNARAFDVEITVVRDDKTATLKATIDKSIPFDEGKRYIFTLEVKNSESSLLMKVLDWNTIAFTDGNVGGPDEPYPDPDINEGIGTTVTIARWTEIQWSGNGNIGGG
ncbi:fimbrillin family protein [uncultured Parabacteroides sp.]|uniref:BF2992 family fimbrillin-A clan protein n=1 Tax=uncultured Parabacteroides sp. TaxID=512312 RepID=UPI00259AD090|nr:fimbrillin family protein [uncultured Parabacteroides sp.]